jgi:hypothetical protein
VGERISSLKGNGRVVHRSPLSTVLELEALLAGIDAKRCLWRSLRASGVACTVAVDFDALIEQASNQRSRLTPFHHDAAIAAFEPLHNDQ